MKLKQFEEHQPFSSWRLLSCFTARHTKPLCLEETGGFLITPLRFPIFLFPLLPLSVLSSDGVKTRRATSPLLQVRWDRREPALGFCTLTSVCPQVALWRAGEQTKHCIVGLGDRPPVWINKLIIFMMTASGDGRAATWLMFAGESISASSDRNEEEKRGVRPALPWRPLVHILSRLEATGVCVSEGCPLIGYRRAEQCIVGRSCFNVKSSCCSCTTPLSLSLSLPIRPTSGSGFQRNSRWTSYEGVPSPESVCVFPP